MYHSVAPHLCLHIPSEITIQCSWDPFQWGYNEEKYAESSKVNTKVTDASNNTKQYYAYVNRRKATNIIA